MWIFVMFDLPVGTKAQRREASQFRNKLLDLGFNMVQFSVYNKCCSGKEVVESLSKKISVFIPTNGYVDILYFTDKQFENIIRYEKKVSIDSQEITDQLILI